MATNLFVTIPSHHPGAHPSNYFAGSASSIGWAIPNGNMWLAAHVSLGLALVLGGLITIFVVARRGRTALATAMLGAASIIGAAFNGASFLDFNQDYSSMIMAGLFAVAIASYIVGLYGIPGTDQPPGNEPPQVAARSNARRAHRDSIRGLQPESADPALLTTKH